MLLDEQIEQISTAARRMINNPDNKIANNRYFKDFLNATRPIYGNRTFNPTADVAVFDAVRPYYADEQVWPASDVTNVEFLKSVVPDALPLVVVRILIIKHKVEFENSAVQPGWTELAQAYGEISYASPGEGY